MKEQKIVLLAFVGVFFLFVCLLFFFLERGEAATLTLKVDRAVFVAAVFYLPCISQNSVFLKHKMQLSEPVCLGKKC